ncbi:Na+/panthothenate symporter [Geoglobus ahangari]|uniref:Na+/panthothenate symporter n=1 Tax=Geoglobus ahangari TaxID=113653 RepID=A0A0F7IGE0_9EURY|nr:sodium:solute symporter [Geoglobus ahangari]AKG90950.1 Na+/panthothenate symporter [Geoglobus ahangari]NOY12010.1 sodium:solute symporter family protein [Archaeoglobi archaeon]
MDLLLVAIIVVAYLLVTGYFGYYGFRTTKDSEDYLVAGRRIHPVIMALSYGAAFISTSAIVGFGGVASIFGFSLLWLTFLNILVGIIIAYAVVGKRVRKKGLEVNALTFPELMGKMYNSRFIQVFSGLIVFLFMPLYAGVVLIGAARFIEVSLNIDYNIALFIMALIIAMYVVYGGLIAVVYTDAFQGTIMLASMVVLLAMTYSWFGGIVQAHEALTSLNPVAIKIFAQKIPGYTGWTNFPELGSAAWWTLVSSLILGVGIGVLAQPQLAVRFMTVASDRDLDKAVPIGSIFIFFTVGTAFIVGALSNAYFMETVGKPSIAVAGGNVDKVIPAYISSFMPDWFVAVFLVTLLAAAMSTLSSQFHTIGSALGRDVFQAGFLKGKYDERTVLITRMAIAVGILFSIFLAYILPPGVIARGTAMFFALCASSFLPAYLGGLYWSRASSAGAKASIVVGFATSMIYITFFHIKESSALGIARMLFGKDALAGFPWTVIDPMVIALPLATLTFVVVSLLSRESPSGS